MKKVYIIGAGGHALVVKSIIDTGNKFKVEGFIKKDGEDKNLLKIKNLKYKAMTHDTAYQAYEAYLKNFVNKETE